MQPNDEILKNLTDLLKNMPKPDLVPFKEMVGKEVVVRTRNLEYWFGTLLNKVNEEVLLRDAQNLIQCYPKEGSTMPNIADSGVNVDSSATRPTQLAWFPVSAMYLCTEEASTSIKEAPVI